LGGIIFCPTLLSRETEVLSAAGWLLLKVVVPPLPFSFQQPPAFAALLGQTDSSPSGIIIPPPPLPTNQSHSESRNSSVSDVAAASPQLAVLAASPPSTVDQQGAFATAESSEELDVVMTSEPPSISTQHSTEIWQGNLTNTELPTPITSAADTIATFDRRPTETTTLSSNQPAALRTSVSLLNSVGQNMMPPNNIGANGREPSEANKHTQTQSYL
jgi:hypothetical protein